MEIIGITREQLEIVIQNAIIEALNIKLNAPGLPERCTFKEALEITGLSKSLLYQKTMNKAIPFGNRLVFSSKELQGWVAEQLEIVVKNAESTRLKIPLLITEEGTHGLMCSGGTIFPEGLGIGSTWNMNLVKEIYTVAAREARAVGIHQLFTLVIEPNRDPRLGRNEEGYSEDPYLCSRIAESIVAGTQGDDISAPDKVVAGLCKYNDDNQTQQYQKMHTHN